MSKTGLDLNELEIDPVFEFTLYNGYTKQALKGHKGKTMPSIGITDTYICPYHYETEYLSLIDIDKKFPHDELFRKVEIAIFNSFTSHEPPYLISRLKPRSVKNCKTTVPSYIITESKYGHHVIIVSHTTKKDDSLKIQEYITHYLTIYGIYVDIWHQKIGIERGRTIIRIFGKYADDPLVKVIKAVNTHDPVVKELLKLYDTARWVKIWASLTQLQSPDSF